MPPASIQSSQLACQKALQPLHFLKKVSTPLSTMGASRLKFLDILDFIFNKNQQLQEQFK